MISVVVPVYNEESCVEGTVRELLRVLSAGPADYEVIAVDDGSTDGTLAILDRLKKEFAALRVLRLQPNSGQSAAFGAGFRAARGETIVTMDADGQNDPAEIPRLVAALAGHDCCCGYRANRRDPLSRRLASRFANAVRNRVLREDVVDVGCSLKAFKAELVQDLVMWKGMHRFMPALFRMQGADIVQIPVNHRPRASGRSKYTNWRRLKQTVWDLWAVRWMQRRHTPYGIEER